MAGRRGAGPVALVATHQRPRRRRSEHAWPAAVPTRLPRAAPAAPTHIPRAPQFHTCRGPNFRPAGTPHSTAQHGTAPLYPSASSTASAHLHLSRRPSLSRHSAHIIPQSAPACMSIMHASVRPPPTTHRAPATTACCLIKARGMLRCWPRVGRGDTVGPRSTCVSAARQTGHPVSTRQPPPLSHTHPSRPCRAPPGRSSMRDLCCPSNPPADTASARTSPP